MEKYKGPPQTDGESDCNEQNYFSLSLTAVQLGSAALNAMLSVCDGLIYLEGVMA